VKKTLWTGRVFGILSVTLPPALAFWASPSPQEGDPYCGLQALALIAWTVLEILFLSAVGTVLVWIAHRRSVQRPRWWKAEIALVGLPALLMLVVIAMFVLG
jgi:hypothetical protein